jgi:hypothetical protein
MRRAYSSVCAVTAAIALALAAPASGATARSSSIIQTIWKLTSASGTQTLNMSGADPDQGLLSVKAHIVTRWRTTTHSALMTFGWPAQRITRDFPDPDNFASLTKVKVDMIGSASGTFNANQVPTPFHCNNEVRRSPETFLPAGTVPITGGALRGAKLGIAGILRSNPEVLFDGCRGPLGLSVHAIISPEQIEVNKPTYNPIQDRHVINGHVGQRLTLNLRVTIPITASTGAKIGTVTSTASLHLAFVQAV